jgi:prepilin-type N-terminal cleavage/methylation domain-containing protein
MKRNRTFAAGFSLVELLVVIGIIALLISLLIPSVVKAQRIAKSISCLSNLRQIGQAMNFYATQYGGAIPGAASTTGRHFFANPYISTSNAAPNLLITSGSNVPRGPISVHDWIAPLADEMGLTIPDSPDAGVRYDAYRNMGVFLCPSNAGVISIMFSSVGSPADPGAGQQLGYATAEMFLLTTGTPTPGVTGVTRVSTGTNSNNSGWPILPDGYTPKITKIGKPADKIYVADASKFVNNTTTVPDFFISPSPTPNSPSRNSGPFTDNGPWTKATGAYDRAMINGQPSATDGRIFSFRHGAVGARQPYGKLALNAVFYDGHAATLDEFQATDPKYWLPSRSVFKSAEQFWPDVAARHAPGLLQGQRFVVP